MQGDEKVDSVQQSQQQHGKIRFSTRLRNYFLTGLVVTGPIGITLWLTWTFIQWVDSWMTPLVPVPYRPETYLPFSVPGFGVIVALFLLTIVGFLAANILGRSFISVGENVVGKMPLVRNIYSGLKQIFETVLNEKGSSFSKAGLIEYPRKGLWAVVFIATKAKGEVASRLHADEDHMVSVFLPTTPNPTSGFLLYVRRSDITELDMSVEDAAKLVISAGLVSPEYPSKLKDFVETTNAPADRNHKQSDKQHSGNSEESRKQHETA